MSNYNFEDLSSEDIKDYLKFCDRSVVGYTEHLKKILKEPEKEKIKNRFEILDL